MTALSFAFTKIYVADLPSMEKFYRDVLQLKRIMHVSAGSGATAVEETILGVGDETLPNLNLVQYLNAPCPPPGEAITGFMVSDTHEVIAAAIAAGGSLADEPHDVPEYQLRVAYIKDPEGHMIEIMQSISLPGN